MADRFPLILNTSNNQIQEIASGDNLDLTGTGINNAGIITATTFKGNGDFVELDVDGHTNLDNVSIAGVTTISGAAPNLLFTETDANPDFGILLSAGQLKFQDVTNAANILTLDDDKIQAVKNLDALAGIDVTGNLIASGNLTANNGTITVSGTAPKITFTETNDNPDYKLEANGGNIAFVDTTNSATRLSISSSGINVTGNGTFSGNVSIGGTLTYEDVTNIDSVGVVTAREGIFIPDNKVLHLGNVSGTGDLQIYHDTNNSYVKDVGTGDLVLQTQGGHVRIKYGSETMALFQPSNKAELYYQNSPKLATTNTGVTVTGTVAATTFSGSGASLTNLNGSNIASGTVPVARIGTGTKNNTTFYRGDGTFQVVSTDLVGDSSPQLGGDLDFNGNNALLQGAGGNVNTNWDNDAWEKIVFDASYNSNAQGPNKIVLQNDTNWKAGFGIAANELGVYSGADIAFYGLTTDSTASTKETFAKFTANGAVDLYHNNIKKFETTSSGATVTGNLNVSANIIGNSSHTTEIGSYNDGMVKRVRMSQGGEIHFGDTTTSNFFGITEGVANNFTDQDKLGIYCRNELKIYTNNNNARWVWNSSGHFLPVTNDDVDIGSTSNRVRNIYTNDLNLSNEGSSNDVDGTWGNYTIQEGESDLFLINNRSGKKYKFNLTEVS